MSAPSSMSGTDMRRPLAALSPSSEMAAFLLLDAAIAIWVLLGLWHPGSLGLGCPSTVSRVGLGTTDLKYLGAGD